VRVLVTGASGRLGRWVVPELASEHELVLFSRTRPDEEVLAGHEWIQGNLTDYADIRKAIEGVKAVQHLGAQADPSDHPRAGEWKQMRGVPFDATIKTNVLGTYYVMRAAIEEGVKVVVMAGSNCALGIYYRISNRPFPFRYLPVDEDHPTDVEDTYSFTKLAGEELLAACTRAHGIRTYVTRLGGIMEPERRLRMAERARPITRWYDGLWTWVSAEDSARAHRMLMAACLPEGPQLPAHDVFFVNADDTSALEPSMALLERLRPDLLPLVREPLEGHRSFLSTAKLQAAVGWRHEVSWRDLLP